MLLSSGHTHITYHYAIFFGNPETSLSLKISLFDCGSKCSTHKEGVFQGNQQKGVLQLRFLQRFQQSLISFGTM